MPFLPRFRKLLSDRDGNVVVIFALASIPLLGFTGVAIDYGFATKLSTKLQSATDATALALCQTPASTTAAQLQSKAQTMLTSYMGTDAGLVVDPLQLTANPRKILLTTRAVSPAYFGKFTGTANLNVGTKAQCASPMPKTFEIALVLDTTGSMSSSSGSQSKLAAAQTAASNFIDYVKSNSAFASDSRISIVPFAASVAVDPSAYSTASWVDRMGLSSYHWTNVDRTQAVAAGFTSRLSIFNTLKTTNSSWGWAGCFETQPYPSNVQDGVPTTNDTLYVPMFAPDEPGNGSSTYAQFGSNYSFNSYIDDSNTTAGCTTAPSTFQTAENRACKYRSPRNAQATSYNTYVGLPNGPNFMCVSKPLQRLTTDTSTLKNLINSLTAMGSTNIHEGLLWGWRTISPNSVFADGVSYTSTTTNKIIILMTDGANTWPDNPYTNYNQSMYFSHGYLKNADGSDPSPHFPSSNQTLNTTAQQRAAIDALTQSTCTNSKATGISVYTIGFSVPNDPIDQQGIDLLRNCASSSGQAYVANDSDSLIAAFESIAKSIGALRLTQ